VEDQEWMDRCLHIMLSLNGTNWYINMLGKNTTFYYVTITDKTNSIDYNIDVTEIDATKPVLPQIYNWILTQPEFAGASLI
jgi:hypothetical protein